MKNRRGSFAIFAQKAARFSGQPYTFIIAVAVIVIWAVSGPFFGYSDTWQLIINTSTTIVTFLMVFLIQNTQNRDSQAVQIKLAELIRATPGAHTALLDIEELSTEELEKLCSHYEEIAEIARKRLREGKKDTNIPKVVLDSPDVAKQKSR